jgi:hypothetical protein
MVGIRLVLERLTNILMVDQLRRSSEFALSVLAISGNLVLGS